MSSWCSGVNDGLRVWLPEPEALGALIGVLFVRNSQKPTTAESCPLHVLCSNDSYASKQVKRFPFSAWKCLRRRWVGFTAASHAEGHWFDPSRDHNISMQAAGYFRMFIEGAVPDTCQTGARRRSRRATRRGPFRHRRPPDQP